MTTYYAPPYDWEAAMRAVAAHRAYFDGLDAHHRQMTLFNPSKIEGAGDTKNPFNDMPLDGPWIDDKPQLLNSPVKRVISPIGTPYRLMDPLEIPTSGRPAATTSTPISVVGSSPAGSSFGSPLGSSFGTPVGSPMKTRSGPDPLQVAIDCAVEDRAVPRETVSHFAVTQVARREASRRADVCRFCYERSVKYCDRYKLPHPRLDDPKEEWNHHKMRDAITNVVTCPRLRSVTCEICCATGDNAHIAKLCPMLKNSKFLADRFGRNKNVPH